MGHQQRTPEEDYRHYARPDPGRGGNWVEVIDDGRGRTPQAAADQPSEPFSSSGNPDSAAAGPGGVRASTGPGSPALPRRNVSLWAAWALVALMLAVGLSWLFGVLEPRWDTYAQPTSESGMTGETMLLSPELESNLYSLGPFAMIIGMLGAVTLLALQATMFHGRSRLQLSGG